MRAMEMDDDDGGGGGGGGDDDGGAVRWAAACVRCRRLAYLRAGGWAAAPAALEPFSEGSRGQATPTLAGPGALLTRGGARGAAGCRGSLE